MTTYAIYSDGGQELTSGIHGEEVARATAQRFADDMGETVYLDTVPTSTDPDDDEDCGEAIAPSRRARVRCACGEIYGERCEWTGSRADTVVVEVMPEQHRASHEAAGNSGTYPHNGAIRIRVERSCADRLVDTEDGWAKIR